MSGIMDEIKAKAKGTMPGPNGALVPGPGGDHFSNQRNQAAVDNFDNSSGAHGNLGRGFDTGLDQGDSMNSYGTSGAAGIPQHGNTTVGSHTGNTVGNVGSAQSHAPTGTGFGGTTGSGVGHDHASMHSGHGLHSHGTDGGVGHTGTHAGHGIHNHGAGIGSGATTGAGAGHTGTGLGNTGTHTGTGVGHTGTHTGTGQPFTHGTDARTGHMAGDNTHSYGAGVGHAQKVSSATKGAQYDATGGAVDDRTAMQKIKDTFTPGSDVGKHTKH